MWDYEHQPETDVVEELRCAGQVAGDVPEVRRMIRVENLNMRRSPKESFVLVVDAEHLMALSLRVVWKRGLK